VLYSQTTCLPRAMEHAPPRTVESTLPGDITSARTARRMVRDHLGSDNGLTDDCALMVSELVANAVIHGGSAVRLRLTVHRDCIYAEVADNGTGMPRETCADLDATSGRGLLIVGSLAQDWGVIPRPGGGKLVWFVMGK